MSLCVNNLEIVWEIVKTFGPGLITIAAAIAITYWVNGTVRYRAARTATVGEYVRRIQREIEKSVSECIITNDRGKCLKALRQASNEIAHLEEIARELGIGRRRGRQWTEEVKIKLWNVKMILTDDDGSGESHKMVRLRQTEAELRARLLTATLRMTEASDRGYSPSG